MRSLKLLCVTLLAVSLGRGVRLLAPEVREVPAAFDRAQSAALFIGVRNFGNDRSLGEVRYAVDDAVDLAWVFAMDGRVALVEPKRVVLALEGAPQKKKSQERLTELIRAGALLRGAAKSEIEALLERQVASVGNGGIFIAGVATHGFSREGSSYILTSTSIYEQVDTSIATDRIRSIAARAPRSLLFFDACRERQGARGTPLPPPFLEGLSEAAGQVVFTIAGEFAWDNPAARNGAFTAAVVAGLQCKASADARGFVTVDTLADYVEKRLRTWLRKNRDRNTRSAIQLTTDGDSGAMPLARCSMPLRQYQGPARVQLEPQAIAAFDKSGEFLWRKPTGGAIADAVVADLDNDGANEIVANVDGKLAVFDAKGDPRWNADTNAPGNYDGGGTLRVAKFVVGDLFRRDKLQVVTLSVDESRKPSSRVAVFDVDGKLLGAYFHPGRLQYLAIASPTSHHAPKIVVAGSNERLQETVTECSPCKSVFLLDPKEVSGEAPPYLGKLGFGTQVWYGYVQAASIDGMEIIDCDRDGKRDIFLAVPNGRLSVDFNGHIIEAKNSQFGLVK
jgi:hypothetical protein